MHEQNNNLWNELNRLLGRNLYACREELKAKHAVLDQVLAKQEPAIIYPAARMGRAAARKLQLRGVKIAAFGDGNPTIWDSQIDGLRVLSPEQIGKHNNRTPVLIASTVYDSVITENLKRYGCENVVPVAYLNLCLPEVFVSREYFGAFESIANRLNHTRIRETFSLLADEESMRVFTSKLDYYTSFDKRLIDDIYSKEPDYFDASVYALRPDEVVVDGGAFVGDTLSSFRQISRGSFRAYIAFEPDLGNFAKLSELAMDDPARVEVVPAGLARYTGKLRFLNTSTVDTRVLKDDEPGGETLPVVGLDEFFATRPSPTLIKMDIEGVEADALEGASRMIKRDQPKLAISSYHYPTDLWTIPLLIKRLNPTYKLFLRHYSQEIDNTVCYAIPD